MTKKAVSAQDQKGIEESIRGRALVDSAAHGLKCGEFYCLPIDVANQLHSAGQFDPEAIEIGEQEVQAETPDQDAKE